MDFYIHIGTGKTGSSAIQVFLSRFRPQLTEQFSCLYPNLQDSEVEDFFLGNCINHCNFFGCADGKFIDTQIRKLVLAAEARKMGKVIISCEALSVWKDSARMLHETLAAFPEIRVIVIVYIRRHDHWLESAWKQWGIKDTQFRDIDHFLSEYQNSESYSYNPLELIELWAAEFGDDNIMVQPYEKEQLPDGIIVDFLTKVGIDAGKIPGYDAGKDKFQVNVGFSREVIEMLRLNRRFSSGIHDNRLSLFFTNYLPESYRKPPFEDYSIFSPEQRGAVLARFNPYYEKIARKYLKRSDGIMFREPVVDPSKKYVPFDGLTVEEIVPVFSQMMFHVEKRKQPKKAGNPVPVTENAGVEPCNPGKEIRSGGFLDRVQRVLGISGRRQ